MVKQSYIIDIEKTLKEGKNPMELLNTILRMLDFERIEIRIYNLLLNSPLTVKQLEKQLNLSERTIRKYIKRLDLEGFITKKVEQGKRLKYVYTAIPVPDAWSNVKGKIQQILDAISKVLEKDVFFS
jgi:predicted transcriptional regulator